MGLVDKALPVNLKSIEVAKQLVICKLPFALKVFVAPFVDAHITTQKGLAVGLWLLLAVVASVYSSLEQSSHFFVPSLFVICSFIAISDIMVDNYALVSNYRAFCQVLGILLGRLLSASISLCYEFDLNTMFKIGLLGCVFCTLLLSFSIYLSPQVLYPLSLFFFPVCFDYIFSFFFLQLMN